MKEKVKFNDPAEKRILRLPYVFTINAETLVHGSTVNFGLKCVLYRISSKSLKIKHYLCDTGP